jgi:hypothetical protein
VVAQTVDMFDESRRGLVTLPLAVSQQGEGAATLRFGVWRADLPASPLAVGDDLVWTSAASPKVRVLWRRAPRGFRGLRHETLAGKLHGAATAQQRAVEATVACV